MTTQPKNNDQLEVLERNKDTNRNRSLFSPLADIIETDEKYLIVADIPGCSEKDVNITLEKNVLTIHGVNTSEMPEKKTLILSEYGMGNYYRSFVISDKIDQEKIVASVKNGVLHLILPKSGPAKTQNITIKAG
jgi:HSP20 family protein